MLSKLVALSVLILASAPALGQSDACNVAFRCSKEFKPTVCEIGDAGIAVTGNNNCLATAKAYHVMCKLDFNTADYPLTCQDKPQLSCPVFVPPAPNFCEDGTIVIEKGADGCQLPPRCIRD